VSHDRPRGAGASGGSTPGGPDRPEEEPSGTVRPTSAVTLAAVAITGGLVGGLVPPLVEGSGETVPSVSWTAVLALGFFAAVLVGLARATYRTLHGGRGRLDGNRAVNLLVLGKASALAGAFSAGGYLAFALTYAADTDVALPRERFVHGLFAALAAAAVVVGGVLLERACRVPDDDGDDGARGR